MTWLVDGKTFARKVKNPVEGVNRNGGRGRSIECPSCGNVFGQSNAAQEWPGLPAGVKFDPSDQELLQHLAAKVGHGSTRPHVFIDEFIPTLDGEDGICYTHPEKLPGVRRDGNSIHFFHRPARAYTTGTRKRRKIQSDETSKNNTSKIGSEVRWHKTGKTRPVLDNGVQLGCKKIMVLYTSFGKKTKPDKTNWVMHQYHLGEHEEEREGELVVSKVFYQTQPRQCAVLQKGDDDDPQQVELELAEEPAYSFPLSSTSIISAGVNSFGRPPTPTTPGPLHTETIKQRKGLLEAISEDVGHLAASLSVNPQNAGQSSEQSALPFEYTLSAMDCKSGFSEQTPALGLLQRSPDLGEEDTCCSLGINDVQNECEKQPINECITGLQILQVDQTSAVPALGSQEFSDALDSDLMKLLCNENLQADLKLKNKGDAAQSFKSLAAELGFSLDNNSGTEGHKVFSLDNIVLDTPPDNLLESLSSQDILEILGKRKHGGDSQKTTASEDFSFDFLRDSQSSS